MWQSLGMRTTRRVAGGVGLKLGFYWAEAARIAKKQQRQVTKEEDEKFRYDGEIVSEKGDIYFRDCTVTGSDLGTSSDPKFRRCI